jgi:two-component system chemotaxis response regulator CheY
MSKKILVVDDSAFMRKILIEILKEAGYTDIVEGENGRQAIEKYNSEKPDLMLMDIIMPEMDGIEVLKQIGKTSNIIVISAVGQEGVIAEAKTLGAKGFIVKPFNNAQVKEEISKFL